MLRRARALQIRAFLLLLVFLSSGTALPSLDAIVYHNGSADVGSRSHVEVPGGCVDHTGHCSLGRTAPGSNAVAALGGPVHREAIPQPAQILPADGPRTGADYHTTARPRAPPSPVV